MRYQVLSDQHSDSGALLPFFETEDLQEAKEFAIRLTYFGDHRVAVRDEKLGEIIRNFDDPKHRK